MLDPGLLVFLTPRTKLWDLLCFLSLLVMIVSENEPGIKNITFYSLHPSQSPFKLTRRILMMKSFIEYRPLERYNRGLVQVVN